MKSHILEVLWTLTIGMFTGWVGSVLDSTWTQPAHIGWQAKRPAITSQYQQLESVLGSGECQSVHSPVEVARFSYNSPNLGKKSPKFDWDLTESSWISPDQILIWRDLAGVLVYRQPSRVARVLEKETHYSTRWRWFLEARTTTD